MFVFVRCFECVFIPFASTWDAIQNTSERHHERRSNESANAFGTHEYVPIYSFETCSYCAFGTCSITVRVALGSFIGPDIFLRKRASLQSRSGNTEEV